jgi:hypothetical protein
MKVSLDRLTWVAVGCAIAFLILTRHGHVSQAMMFHSPVEMLSNRLAPPAENTEEVR